MTLLRPAKSPPRCIPDTVLLETSYDEEFGSSQTECSKIPLKMCDFPILTKGMVSAPPLLDELQSESDSSLEESFLSHDFDDEQQTEDNVLLLPFSPSNIQETADSDDNIEVHLDDGDSFYTAIMEAHSCSRSSSPATTCAALPVDEKRVRFSTAEIRSYNVIVGDHPACAAGLPLSLDWSYNPTSRKVSLVKTNSNDDGEEEEEDVEDPSSFSCHSSSRASKAQRLDLLQRMKILKKFYRSQDLWMAERQRRKVLEEEIVQEEAALLCTCHNDDDDDSIAPYRNHDEASCDVLQCLTDATE